MAVFTHATVVDVAEEMPGLVTVRVVLEDGRRVDAAAFPQMVGPIAPGDRVVVNTTGIALELGTGGVGFVLWNESGPGPSGPGPGHIMKLRYTPWQMNVLAAEEADAPTHPALQTADGLDGMPVVAGGLHSQIAGVAAGVKAVDPTLRVGYLMTDAAALPIAFSRLVRRLRKEGLIDTTVTCGHAFGGDLEAINVYSGLVALRVVARVDVAIAALGPGVVGTNTRLGFSAIEQGQLLDAAAALKGRGVACLRISFADDRARHRGVSHHSLTALQIAARERCSVVVPALAAGHREEVTSQLIRAGIPDRHDIVQGDGRPGVELLTSKGIEVQSMGRAMGEIPELFLAAAAAGRVAGDMASR